MEDSVIRSRAEAGQRLLAVAAHRCAVAQALRLTQVGTDCPSTDSEPVMLVLLQMQGAQLPALQKPESVRSFWITFLAGFVLEV